MKATSAPAPHATSDPSSHRFCGTGGLRTLRSLGSVLPVYLGLLISPVTSHAATPVVTSIMDSGPGSLREILANADAESTVTFDPSLKGQTLVLTSGALVIQKNLTLLGLGASSFTIQGNGSSRLFTFAAGTTNTLSGLTLTKGKAPDGILDFLNPSNRGGRHGGAIYAEGSLILKECILQDNQSGAGAVGQGGSLSDEGFAAGPGGAGGAIFATGPLTLSQCTLSNNRSGDGGAGGLGIDAGLGSGAPGGPGTDGGAGGDGGAIYATGPLILSACTLTGNLSGAGGARGDGQPGTPGGGGGVRCGSEPAVMWNTLVAGNSSDVLGDVASQGYNLIGRIEGCTGIVDGVKGDRAGTAAAPLDPLLGPLANNGGPTQTHALQRGSPAIDAGDSAFEIGRFSTDQRGSGFRRISNHRIDIGAYEVQEPKASQPRVRPEGVTVTIQGEPNETLVIEWNSEARTDGWQSLATGGTDETGLLEVRDPNPQAPRRFYRSIRR